MRKRYELTVIYKDSENERKEGIKLLDELFTKHDVKVQTKDEIGSRVLAYDIEDNKKGFYVFYLIDIDNKKIDKLSSQMRLSTLFLRFLIVKREELTIAQKAKKDAYFAKIRAHLAKKSATEEDSSALNKEAAESTGV